MPDRPSRDEILMDTAWLWSQRGTCSRAYVGCVISREGRSLSNGYNGAPAGMEHCNHECNCRSVRCIYHGEPGCPCELTPGENPCPVLNSDHLPECPSQQPCTLAVHAEANALAFAARFGVVTEGAELHTTRVPCRNCAMLIINAGIRRVVWSETHRDMSGLQLLNRVGVDVWRHSN